MPPCWLVMSIEFCYLIVSARAGKKVSSPAEIQNALWRSARSSLDSIDSSLGHPVGCLINLFSCTVRQYNGESMEIPCPDGFLLSPDDPLFSAHTRLNDYLVAEEERSPGPPLTRDHGRSSRNVTCRDRL